MNYLLAIWIVFINCILSIATMQQIRTDSNNRAYVQALCDWSHNRIDGSLERRCGEAQDQRHVEYLCVTRSMNFNCWTEVK